MKFTPRPYQRLIINHIATHPKCAIWAGMGMGKTASVLHALVLLDAMGEDVFPALIVAPLRVAKSVWAQEAKKWEGTAHLKVCVLSGLSEAKRIERFWDSIPGGPDAWDIVVWNYEQSDKIRAKHHVRHFKTVVFDESTRLKGFRTRQGGQRAKDFAEMFKDYPSERIIELTGTPAPNGLKDLWGQVFYLDGGARLGKTFTAFKQRWFNEIQVAQNAFALQPRPYAQKEIQDRVRDIALSLDPADWFDLKEHIVTNIEVELPPKARKKYAQLEEQLFTTLESGDTVEAANGAVATCDCLQLANGAIYTDKGWETIHDEKLQALDSVIEEAAGMPVLVAYHFKHDLERLKARYPAGRVLDKSPDTIAAWNRGEIPVLFAHPQSAGHGLNLQEGGNIIVFFGLWWALEEYQQIIERIGAVRQAQAGFDRPTFVYHIVAKDTVDELVLKRISTKASIQDILLDALKKRSEGHL